jgi:uncharacterized protein
MAPTADLLEFAAAIAAAGIVGGLIAGLLGVGGGIVIVPVLFTIFQAIGISANVAIKAAVATSLATIIVTSLSSARSHHRRGAVDYQLLKRWIVPVVIGVAIGTLIGGYANGKFLTAVFGTVAFLAALNLILRRNNKAIWTELPDPRLLAACGGLVGLIAAMMGIGGGMISVPILTAFGYDMRKAIGTAAAVGFIIAIPAVIGYTIVGWNVAGLPPFSLGYFNLLAFAAVAPLTSTFAPLGARLAHSLPQSSLRMAFAAFLIITSGKMLWPLV